MFAAFEFPPIDELFRWKDIVFEDTPFAINKTSLLVLISSALILLIFIGGSRKMKLVPSGIQNVVEMTYEFIDNGITRDVIGNDATRFTPFLGSLFLFVLFLNFWEIIPVLQFPPTSRIAIPLFLVADGLRPLLVPRVQAPGDQVPHRPPVPAGRPEAALPPADPDRVHPDRRRPAVLAGGPTLRQHDGGPHPAHRARAADRRTRSTNAPIIAIGPFVLNVGVTAFELLVGFLQAYIFTLLTAVYIADSLHPEH